MGGDIGARLPDFLSKTAAPQFLLRNNHPKSHELAFTSRAYQRLRRPSG